MKESSKQKIRKSLLGRYGPQSRNWKGRMAGYVAIHLWVRKHIGIKKTCKHCDKTAKQVSRLELANISGKYLRTKTDWLTLCPSCHRKYDYRRTILSCPQGHKYTKENTVINCRGHRLCKICSRQSVIEYRRRKQNVA